MVLDNTFDTHPPIPDPPTKQTHSLTTFNHRLWGQTHTHTHVDMSGHVGGDYGMLQGWGQVEGLIPMLGMV